MPIRAYTEPTHYSRSVRVYLHPLLKAFIGKGPDFTDHDRLVMYGIGTADFSIQSTPQNADIAILPLAWNYYLETGNQEMAMAIYKKARKYNLMVFSWNAGDFGVRVPDLEGLVVHRTSGLASKLSSAHRGMPVFFGDPLSRIFDRDDLVPRQKGTKPVIGFCGQAKGNPLKYALDWLRSGYRNIRYQIGLSYNEPQSLYPSTLLRSRVLKKFENDDRIQTNYIIRKKYRAGAQTREDRKRTTLEFYENMVGSDYIVCVRGGGNFSVRLYETLAMGRIPIFVNTDCLLPMADSIKWNKHVVWAEINEIEHIADKVMQFHESLSDKAFLDLQESNRRLWKEKLSIGFFFLSSIKGEL